MKLSPYERWMVRSNLEYAKRVGIDVVVKRLRANGYIRVAEAVREAYDSL